MDNKLIDIIKKDIKKKANKYQGNKYYFYKQDNLPNEINTYSNGKITTMKVNDNCFLYTNYFRMLVDQKINYILAKEPEIKLNEIYNHSYIFNTLEDLLLNASLNSVSWLHFYVKDNKLDWIIVNDCEIIPKWDKYKKDLEAVIRYYFIDQDTIKVETWTLQGVKVDLIHKDKIVETNIYPHYEESNIYNDKIDTTEGKNLTFIPFIPLYNNKCKESDLIGIQDLLDMYNSINSGFINNINLFQEAIIKLKGFSATGEDLKDIMEAMRKYKMVSIPSGGNDNSDMEYLAVEIPVEARKVLLDLLKENIFKIGQGLDPDRLAGESNLTNVVLKARYSALDMKANGTQKQLKLFYIKFVECINKFHNTKQSDEVTFNRSMIFNESEQIDNCLKSQNIVDQETNLDNHPWVTNSKEIIKRLETERQEEEDRNAKAFEASQNAEKNLKTNDITGG